MNSSADILDQVASDLRDVLSGDALAGLTDAERATVLVGLGQVSRLADAAIVETVAAADPEFGHRFGCRGANELLQRTLLTDAPSASKLTRSAVLVRRDLNIVSGERLAAHWPALRDALLDGAISVEGLLGATAPLVRAGDRITTEERAWADGMLANAARGRNGAEDVDGDDEPDAGEPDAGAGDTGGSTGPQATADDLRQLGHVLAAILDPDGAEPDDSAAQASRYLSLGRLRKGTHPLKGNVTPEVAAQLQLIFDAFGNPKVGGAPAPGVGFRASNASDASDASDEKAERDASAEPDPLNDDPRNMLDPRTAAQKRHDALAAALGIAARHGEMPSLGGGSPTLVVNVDARDLAANTGSATLAGSDARVPLHVAAHIACTGVIQRVFYDHGRIVGTTVTDRVFTVHQRRAIVARDKECLIPGCHVPATWCEIHHVVAHADGGPTDTDNGVPLCWWHHRSIDYSEWEIRMLDGVPQIRGPGWWDPEQRWRTPRLSATPDPPRRC